MTRRITLGNYELTGVLGRGGAGEVYLAEDTALGREVAFKTLHNANGADGSDWRKRFKLEARTLAQLNCSNIAAIYALESFDTFDAIIMEYVKGPTLAALTGKLSAAAVIHAGLELAKGLEVAHAAGVLHRDLKPANAITKSDGTVKLIDFGIAQQEGGERLTRQGCLVGTLHYMAPEAFSEAGTSPSTDVYGLAATLYELAAGAPPFAECSETELLRAKMDGLAPKALPASIDAGLRSLIEDGLKADPKTRIADISAFRTRLEALGSADGRDILVKAIARTPNPRPGPLTSSLVDAMRRAGAGTKLMSDAQRVAGRARARVKAVVGAMTEDTAVFASASAFTIALALVGGLFLVQSGSTPAAVSQPEPHTPVPAFTLSADTPDESTSERLSRLLNTPVSQPTFHEPRIAYEGPREVEPPRSSNPTGTTPTPSAPRPVAEPLPLPQPAMPVPAAEATEASPAGESEVTTTNPEPAPANAGSEWTWKDT